jgi:hypothetical protein
MIFQRVHHRLRAANNEVDVFARSRVYRTLCELGLLCDLEGDDPVSRIVTSLEHRYACGQRPCLSNERPRLIGRHGVPPAWPVNDPEECQILCEIQVLLLDLHFH